MPLLFRLLPDFKAEAPGAYFTVTGLLAGNTLEKQADKFPSSMYSNLLREASK